MSEKISENKAILVTGGSGFMGRPLVRRFAEDGRTVVSMYHRRLPEAIQGVYPVCSDMTSAELLAAPLRGVDTVVHLAWDQNFVGPSDPTVEWTPCSSKSPLNVQNTRRLVLAMERAKTRRIIFMSALGAGRDEMNPFLREKYLAEQIVLNSAIPEKIILRPSIVCGPHTTADKFLSAMTRLMKIPGFYPVPRQKVQLAPVHLEDLTRVVANIVSTEIEDPCALIEIHGGAAFKISEMLRVVSEKFAGGSRIAIGGVVGEWMMSYLERPRKDTPFCPQLRHFLNVRAEARTEITHHNPLAAAIPPKMRTFKEIVG
jgi:nucleoside-diphosphate-sugar epimerase